MVQLDKSKFEVIAERIGKLVTKKNKAYGNAFIVSGEILKLIFPDGVKPDQYTDLLLINRIVDKLIRISNDKGAFDESPYDDIAGYGILGVSKDAEPKVAKAQPEVWHYINTLPYPQLKLRNP